MNNLAIAIPRFPPENKVLPKYKPYQGNEEEWGAYWNHKTEWTSGVVASPHGDRYMYRTEKTSDGVVYLLIGVIVVSWLAIAWAANKLYP